MKNEQTNHNKVEVDHANFVSKTFGYFRILVGIPPSDLILINSMIVLVKEATITS